ncbi:MAG TPA: AI-2E family transporter [Flavisolibacter sp.]|nr:AI-2E family transporter [Flavisolibacter sp.]
MQQKQEVNDYPFYIKAPAILLALVLIVFILYILAAILIPLAFAILIAILLNPLYVRLETVMPKMPAIILSILMGILLLAGLFYFLSTQISGFVDSIPLLQKKITILLNQLQVWAKDHFGINLQQQIASLKNASTGGGSMLTNTVGTILGTLGVVFLIPIYIFMLLFYKPLILDFLFQVFSEKYSLRVAEILSQTKSAVQSFMQGLMMETAIVCILNSTALLIIGVPSAIVIGVIGGILNLLPYIGGLVAIALPVLMVTVTREGYSGQLLVVASYLLIQFIDNNILVPRIVSSKVQINALMSIIVVLLGGALWGISGMFLSIPFIGVLKIIFDRVDGLKPWGRLLGDEVPSEHIGLVWQKRWDRIFRRMQQKKALETEANRDTAASNE